MRRVLAKVSLMLMVCCAVVLGNAVPAVADETPVWEPGPEWGTAEYTELPQWDRSVACEAGESWSWTSDQGQIHWQVVPCDGVDTARGAALWEQPPGRVIPDAATLGDEQDQVWWLADTQQVVRRWMMETPDERGQFVQVSVSCATDDATQCAQESAGISQEIADAMPGQVQDVSYDVSRALIMALVGPGMFWLILVLPWRGVRALLRPRYAMTNQPPRVQDLSTAVRRARINRAVRRVAMVPAAVFVLLSFAAAYSADIPTVVGVTAMTAGCVGLLALAYRFAGPHPVERGRRLTLDDTRGRGILGTALTTVAYCLLPVLLVVYILVSAYGQFVPGWPVTSAAEVAGRPEPLVGLLYDWAVGPARNLVNFLIIMLIPGLVVLFAIDLLGQRLRAATVADVLARDRRPHYLYLRSFDEDTLKMPGLLRRRGLIGALTVFRKVRFEEVLVRQLSMTGPVIAIAPPGSKLPPIGAARASFDNDEWQAHVEHYARTARAVVLSATPREVRAGFGWEIDLVANRMGHGRVMVVLGPWSKTQLVHRWRQFCQAVAHLPLFAPMAMTWVPAGVQLLAHSDRQGWRAWGARSRTDWTYSMAVDQATREYLPDWS